MPPYLNWQRAKNTTSALASTKSFAPRIWVQIILEVSRCKAQGSTPEVLHRTRSNNTRLRLSLFGRRTPRIYLGFVKAIVSSTVVQQR